MFNFVIHGNYVNFQFMDFNSRQALILAAVIKEYINTGHPVGSKEIAENYNLGCSPATVRSEMAGLEKEGYLKHPHTSAGRVPTDKGYKIFVGELMRRFELTDRERKHLRAELLQLKRKHEELGRSISKLLSDTTNQAAFALLPEASGTAGAANLIDEESEAHETKEAVSFLEQIEEHSRELLKEYFSEKQDEPEVYIGKEIKLADTSNYTLIVSGVRLPSGEKGLIGIVGPKRMKYDKNLSVVEYVAKLLSSGLGAYIILINLPISNF